MSFIFGDSFDCYAAPADAVLGYWDSGTVGSVSLGAGRFAGSQMWSTPSTAAAVLVKSSGSNDAIHHLSIAFRQTAVLSGSTLGLYFQFSDGATNQCCIVFRQDGTILLTSATPAGTTLATYAGAVTAASTWFQFEFEVVINNTTGSFKVRKNGATSDDHSTTSINTRPGANAYANKLTLGMQASVNAHATDDLLWRSDAASVAWVGDIRAYTRMPAADASVQFARAPSPLVVTQTTGAVTTASKTANSGLMSAFIVPYGGTISSAAITLTTGGTGNMKAAIYDSTRTTVLATSNAVVNPATGANTITFGTPLTVTKGATYHLAFDHDTTLVYPVTAANQFTFTTTYASFPAASPTITASTSGPVFTVNITPTVSADYVNETLQDGATSYVYDAVAGHADFYTVAALPTAPANTVAVTTRAFVAKGDAGTRTGAVQLKSGASTVASPTLALSTSFGWTWRTDTVDPATSTAWTAAAVSACTIGPAVIA